MDNYEEYREFYEQYNDMGQDQGQDQGQGQGPKNQNTAVNTEVNVDVIRPPKVQFFKKYFNEILCFFYLVSIIMVLVIFINLCKNSNNDDCIGNYLYSMLIYINGFGVVILVVLFMITVVTVCCCQRELLKSDQV